MYALNNYDVKLEGHVQISGAKNAALKVLTASILTDNLVLHNINESMLDIQAKLQMLRYLGAKIEKIGAYAYHIDNHELHRYDFTNYKGSRVRTTILFLGALISKFRRAVVQLPGGCKIGERPFDIHFDVLKKFGVKCLLNGEHITASADKKIVGIDYTFPKISTGATENAILTAVMADGKTLLKRAHTRPEVIDLINFLNSIGARISVKGNGIVEIIGPTKFISANYSIIYDNMEALTYAVYCGLANEKSQIEIYNFPLKDLIVPVEFLKSIGLHIYIADRSVIVRGANDIGCFDISTGPYPNINSDMQPLFVALAHKARGACNIIDIRFRDRFSYLKEFEKLGSTYFLQDNKLTVEGPQILSKGYCIATDLRAGAALVGLSILSKGEVFIDNISQIERGYPNFTKNLKNIGFSIKTVPSQ